MKVTLIDYTGKGHKDPAYAARLLVYTKNTRLTQGDETRAKIEGMAHYDLASELDQIAKTIRSSWEFIDYTFEITGVTRAFTHQFVRGRHGSYAQQSMRAVDMEGYDNFMPHTVANLPEANYSWCSAEAAIRESYKKLKSLGIPNEDARGILPTNILTNIIAKFNLRTIADMIPKRDNARAQGEYQEVMREMESRILTVHPWTKSFLRPERAKTPALDQLLKEQLGQAAAVDKPELNKAMKELEGLKGVWG